MPHRWWPSTNSINPQNPPNENHPSPTPTNAIVPADWALGSGLLPFWVTVRRHRVRTDVPGSYPPRTRPPGVPDGEKNQNKTFFFSSSPSSSSRSPLGGRETGRMTPPKPRNACDPHSNMGTLLHDRSPNGTQETPRQWPCFCTLAGDYDSAVACTARVEGSWQ